TTDESGAYDKLRTMLGKVERNLKAMLREVEGQPAVTSSWRGFVAIAVLVAIIGAALTIPSGSPIPAPVGIGLLGVVILGVVWLAFQAVRQTGQRQPSPIQLPPAYIEVLQSDQPKLLG